MAVTSSKGSAVQATAADEQKANQVISAAKVDAPTGAEEKAAKAAISEIQAYLDSLPKVRIRVREDEGDQWVQINEHVTIIKAGEWVNVPTDIADMLATAGVI